MGTRSDCLRIFICACMNISWFLATPLSLAEVSEDNSQLPVNSLESDPLGNGLTLHGIGADGEFLIGTSASELQGIHGSGLRGIHGSGLRSISEPSSTRTWPCLTRWPSSKRTSNASPLVSEAVSDIS